MHLVIGHHRYGLATTPIVMGILNRTRDSFYDHGAHFELDAFVRHADLLVAEGADILDVGGVKAGPGPDVTIGEELDRVVPAVEALVARFDVPVSADTWRAEVVRAAFNAGAVMGNDISGFADPDYLAAAVEAGASIVATHIRLAPRVADPQPCYPAGVVPTVRDALAGLARRAEAAGIPSERIVIDAGLDLGKTWQQSVELLRGSDRLAALGYPLLLSASNKTFLGRLLDLDVDQRDDASAAAIALGVARGCRIIRAHDVRRARRICTVVSAVLEAR